MIYYDFKNKMIKFIFLLFYVKQITNENKTREKKSRWIKLFIMEQSLETLKTSKSLKHELNCNLFKPVFREEIRVSKKLGFGIKSFNFKISKTGNERYSDASFLTDLYVLRKNSKFNPLT